MNQYDDLIEGALSGWGAPFPINVAAGTADLALIGMEVRLCGWSFGETTAAGTAKAYLRNGSGTAAPIVAVISLASGAAETTVLMPQGLLCNSGLFLDRAGGNIEGSVWVRTAQMSAFNP